MDEELVTCAEAVAAARLLAGPAHHLSDVAAANLYLFRRAHGYRLAGGALPHVSGRAYDGTRLILPLFPLAEASPAELAGLLGEDGWLYPFTPDAAAALGPGWAQSADPGDADYIYRRERLATLAGSHDRRRQAERFAGEGPVSTLALDAPGAVEIGRAVLDEWLAGSGKAAPATDHAACAEALDRLDALGLFGLVVLRGGAPAGLVIASAPWPDMAIVHFAKGVRAMAGVYPWMFAKLAQAQTRADWINFEQDLGNPGFRQAKRAFGPDHLAPKLRLRPPGAGPAHWRR